MKNYTENEGNGYYTKVIPLSEIKLVQSRAAVDASVVDEYAERMEAGDSFPPGEAVYDGGTYWVYDGCLRFEARVKRDGVKMKLNIRDGRKKDAIWLSLSANQIHGLRRTNADKHHVVEQAIKLRPDLSDGMIAEHCGVSQQMVNYVRKEMEEGGFKDAEEHTGRDGRKRRKPQRKPKPEESKDKDSEDNKSKGSNKSEKGKEKRSLALGYGDKIKGFEALYKDDAAEFGEAKAMKSLAIAAGNLEDECLIARLIKAGLDAGIA